jgi:hypothetical protein
LPFSALAKQLSLLVFEGGDFAETDIRSAVATGVRRCVRDDIWGGQQY